MRRSLFLSLALVLTSCGSAQREVVLHAADEPPTRLSQWGVVFTAGGQLELNDRVTPYELNSPLFSDYALKLRTVWMPEGVTAKYTASEEFEFPVGTIISKTFHYEKMDDWSPDNFSVHMHDAQFELASGNSLSLADHVLIETRLLVRYADGWRGYPYVWNIEQTDATLEIAGDVRAIKLVAKDRTQNINYVVPDANQCSGCHTPDHSAGELRPLGPKAWQLSRAYAWWGDAGNQLLHWASNNLLQGLPKPLPATPKSRVRAYLDANCAHCHNPSGAADTSGLHLNLDAPIDRHYGICKSPVAVGRGSGDRPYDIYPGRPDDSIVLYRMAHADPAIAMPELGRSAIHVEGVAMVRNWIAALPGEC